MVAGSRIRLDIQDLLGALFFLTVALLLALKHVLWNGNHPVQKQLTMNHLLGGGVVGVGGGAESDFSLTCD